MLLRHFPRLCLSLRCPRARSAARPGPLCWSHRASLCLGSCVEALHPWGHMVPTKWSLGAAVPQLLELWPRAPDTLLIAVINPHSFWLQNVLDLSPVPFLKASLALLSSHL